MGTRKGYKPGSTYRIKDRAENKVAFSHISNGTAWNPLGRMI